MDDAPAPHGPIPRFDAHAGGVASPGADARPGGEGLPSLAQARAHGSGAKWFRLPEESWVVIVAEYAAGATAKQLALKWGVSQGSVYRHVGVAGLTKERRGEALHEEAMARLADQEATREARQASAHEAQLAAHEAQTDPAEAADVLVRRAAARSLAGRLDEALTLLKTAEALRRAAEAAAPEAGEDEDEAPEAEAGPAMPPGVRPDAMERYVEARPHGLWSPPPRTREEAFVARLLARFGLLVAPAGPDTAVARAEACFEMFRAAEHATAAAVLALPWTQVEGAAGADGPAP